MSAAADPTLVAEVARLRGVVAALEARVGALEQGTVPAAVPAVAPATIAAPDRTPDAEPDLRPTATHALFLLGRSILVLAGAFLLRALTEGGTLPPAVGFAAGSAFALALIGLAARAARHGDRTGAGAFGLTSALVAYPLLLETTGISSLVPPGEGALVLVLITASGLALAAVYRLRFLAWVTTLASLATTVILMFALEAPILFGAVLLTLGVGTLLLAYTRGWRLERWLPALVADALILRLAIMAADPAGTGSGVDRPAPGAVLGLALGLLVVYLGIFTYRTLVQGKGARVFYSIQSAAVLLIGYGGAVRIAQAGQGPLAPLLGWLALAAAAAYYTVAFTVIHRRDGRGQGFFYFASLGLVLLVLGSRVVVPATWLGWSWIGLGVATALLGSRFERNTLRSHGAVYLALAGFQTGLFAAAWDAFAAGADHAWHGAGAAAVTTAVAACACWVLAQATRRGPDDGVWRRLSGFGALLTGLAGLGTLLIGLVVPLLGPAPPDASPAILAVVRTAVLAVTVVVLAWQGRRADRRELAWPVYPLLVVGCAKLLLEDLRQGTPLTLTVAFALFGTALIAAPRLLHREQVDAKTNET